MRIQTIALTILTLWPFITFGQSDQIELKNEGTELNDFIPENWRLLDSKTGDLNQDVITDLVFAIQNTDKTNYEFNNGIGRDTIDLNPRIMGIYFGTDSKTYKKELQSNKFIILCDSSTMEEPFRGFNIDEKGVLSIKFNFWFSAGSWSMSNHEYKFLYQDNRFVLIGYEEIEIHRASGKMVDYSINFLTKKMKIVKSNIATETPESEEWTEFELNDLKTIESLKQPFNWEFGNIII
jgi:hypothetical protein